MSHFCSFPTGKASWTGFQMILDEKKEEILRVAHPFMRLKYNLSCRVTGHSQSLLRTHCTSVFHKESIKEKGPYHLVFREEKKAPKRRNVKN